MRRCLGSDRRAAARRSGGGSWVIRAASSSRKRIQGEASCPPSSGSSTRSEFVVEPSPGSGARAGEPLHGLRHPLLSLRLSAGEPDPRVERSAAPRPGRSRGGAAPRHEQLPRGDRPGVSGAVRGVVRPQHRGDAGGHQAGGALARQPGHRAGRDVRAASGPTVHRSLGRGDRLRDRPAWRRRSSSRAWDTR